MSVIWSPGADSKTLILLLTQLKLLSETTSSFKPSPSESAITPLKSTTFPCFLSAQTS
jgi:hypothetical protein